MPKREQPKFWTIPGDGPGRIWISDKIHDEMHTALALAGREGHLNIQCEARAENIQMQCDVTSATAGPIDPAVAEALAEKLAAADWTDHKPAYAPIPPHRRHLYPKPPAHWQAMTFVTYSTDDTNRRACQVAESWSHVPAGALVIHGPTGSGKTHLLAAISHELTDNGLDVAVWEWMEWKQTLRGAFASQDSHDEVEAFVARMTHAAVLMLDDVSCEEAGQGIREVFERVVDRRVNTEMPIVISTNATEAAWQAWSARTHSRLKARAYATWIPMVDRDRRLVA